MGEETTLDKIKADLRFYAEADRQPLTALFALRMFLLTPGFQFVFSLRVMQFVGKIPIIGRGSRRLVSWANRLIFGSEVEVATEIAGGLYVPHPFGIIVACARIGRKVMILQNVAIGKLGGGGGHAVIEDGVEVYAGAVVGDVTLGRNSKVGANSVVISDVPAGATAVGVPARIILPKQKPNFVGTA